MMNRRDLGSKAGYALAALLGAIAGGIAVALASRAIPRMASRTMAGMMQHMATQADCNPAQM